MRVPQFLPAPEPRAAAALTLAALLPLLAACQADRPPTAPTPAPQAPLAFAGMAFQLTIDAQTGRVTTGGPLPAAHVARSTSKLGAARPSLSLVGSEAVALHASNCTFTAVPNNSKQKRCTFDLAIENRLASTDLVPATTSPRLPAGTSGIVPFPFTAAALGVPGGSAVPSPAWDGGLINFFNDFGGCSSKTNDCYRSEVYPGPLHAGETSAVQSVGFDVDKAAQSVSAYIVVAADLRNESTTLRIPSTTSLDGFTDQTGDLRSIAFNVQVGFSSRVIRGFYSFDLGQVPSGVQITHATLRAYQVAVGEPLCDGG